MLDCVIWLLIYAIIAVIVLYVFEAIFSQTGLVLPGPIPMLIRCLVAVLLLIWLISCLGLLTHGGPGPMRR